jgi:hypothetical protein
VKIAFETTNLGEVRLLANAARYKSVLWQLRESLISDESESSQSILARLNGMLDDWGLTLEDDSEPTTDESGCACGRASCAHGDGGDDEDDAMAAGVGRRR